MKHPENPLNVPEGHILQRIPGPQYIRRRYALRGEACPHCGVAPNIREDDLIRAINLGLQSENLRIVADADAKYTGTPIGFLNHLIGLLRRRGMRVI